MAIEDRPMPGDLVTSRDQRLVARIDRGFDFPGRRGKRKKKVLIGTLTLTNVNIAAYGTHCSNYFQLGRDHKDYLFTAVSPRRMAIDTMRNFCVEIAIKGGFDYLFFLDDDTVCPRDGIGQLLKRMKEFNAVSGLYFIRGYPFHPMIFRFDRKKNIVLYKDADRHVDEDGVLRKNVAALGCGCTLFRVEDFKKVEYPWFHTGPNYTEDVYFFSKAHKAIKGYKVGVDCRVSFGHLCDPLYVDGSNVDVMRSFYRKLMKSGGVFQ